MSTVKLLFSEAAKYDATIIFLDEVDAIGRDRNAGNSNPAILLQLMIEMDGFGDRGNVFVLAATNDPDSLDAAFVRPGRFDRSYEIDVPDKATSLAINRLKFKKYKLAPTEAQELRFLDYLGGRVPAFIDAIMNEAVILYHRTEALLLKQRSGVTLTAVELQSVEHRRSSSRFVCTEQYDGETIGNIDAFLLDLKECIDIKSFGRRRARGDESGQVNLTTPEMGASLIAVHEIGHALVTRLLTGSFGLEKITILGRGEAAGYVEPSKNARRLLTKKDFVNEVMSDMGGMAAEQVIYREISRGAVSDIRAATDMTRRMVCMFGFSDEIGFMSLGRYNSGYLGSGWVGTCSAEMQGRADEEVRKLLSEYWQETVKLLSANRDVIEKLATVLFEVKEMDSSAMEEVYQKSIAER